MTFNYNANNYEAQVAEAVVADLSSGPTGPTGPTGATGPTGPTGAQGAGAAVSVPANASATGTAGTWAYDSTHAYFCVATNTWCRVEIATW
jgi:hypothetical protein